MLTQTKESKLCPPSKKSLELHFKGSCCKCSVVKFFLLNLQSARKKIVVELCGLSKSSYLTFL